MDIGTVSSPGFTVASGKIDLFTSLNIGQVINAKIIDFTTNTLLLMMSDGTPFSASTDSDLNAQRGDSVRLQVTDKVNGQVYVKMRENKNAPSPNSQKIYSILEKAGIKADKSTLSAVRLMMEKGMELTGQNLKDILNIVTSLPKTDINTAVLMKSLGLEFSTGNFDNIKNIIEGRLQAGNIINETGSIINNINDAQALAKTGAVFEILKNIEMQTQAAEYNISSDTEVLLNTIPKSEIALFFQRNLEHSEIPSNLLDSFLASQFSHFSLFSEENREELNNILRHVFTNIKNNLQSERAVESDASILKLKNRIVSQIQDNRIILTENDEISNNIGKNLNEKIINRLEILSFIVRENQINDFENMGVRLDLITGQMKFLNNMASLGTYIQIPLILNNHDTTGNIYLMKRKKGSSKIDMDNVTFLISLDTGNLGRVDSLIDINKKNISLDIKTEKNDISSFIKKYYNYLYEKFREMGYRLINMKCSLITGDINILNFEKFIKKEKKEREKSIDYRI